MQIISINSNEKSLYVDWQDWSVSEFPYIWLRDNDKDELHPQTRERVFDLTSVTLDIVPEHCSLEDGNLRVQWPNKTEVSIYPSDWLYAHQLGTDRMDPATVERHFWTSNSLTEIASYSAKQCAGSATELREMLLDLKRYGLILINGLADTAEAGENFGDLIGFKRRTNFDVMFEVISKPDPVNLAYTSIALPLHTDLPNQSMVPSYQFLHCYLNSVSGGESVFADGFKICTDFEKQEPDKFELLKNTSIPWRFHDHCCDIRKHRPIINLDSDGELEMLVFNAHLADIPDMPVDALHAFYAAYQALMQHIRDPKYAVHHLLTPGQMVIFDNRRLLHSRTEFDPSSGERHLRGYYIENNEVNSKIRMLAGS
jgi:gamma-butyrobetaine dioxygenase